jgi:signal transduction histidine kinase
MMRLRLILGAACAGILLGSPAVAEDSATAEEVIQKTREAAEYLAREKVAGIDAFKTMQAPFAWKDDGYVFVNDCGLGRMLANPAYPPNNGRSLSGMTDMDGLRTGPLMCKYGKKPGGGWFAANIPKPGSIWGRRKLIFCRPVPDTTYQVCSGFYSNTADLADLEKLSNAP